MFPVMCRCVQSSPMTHEVHHYSSCRQKSAKVRVRFAQILHVVLCKFRRKRIESPAVFQVDSNFINELREATPR